MEKEARISTCERYRYSLTRVWDADLPPVNIIGLNPSRADESLDDPTVRRCINFAKSWGFGTLWLTNLFAYRAVEPKDIKIIDDPVGPDNDEYIKTFAHYTHKVCSGSVVLAWGNHGVYRDRAATVLDLLGAYNVKVISITKKGQPAHPLYLKKDLKLKGYHHDRKTTAINIC